MTMCVLLALAGSFDASRAAADGASTGGVPATPLPDGAPGNVQVFEGHTVQVPSVAFLPDGRRVMSCAYDGTRVWDVETGELSLNIKPGGLAGMTPDGSKLAIRWGPPIRLHDAATGKVHVELDPVPTDVASTIEFSRDGQWLATGGADGVVRIYDATTGKRVHELKGHAKPVPTVAFHPSERLLISGGTDKTIRVWDLETGEELRQFANPGYDLLSLDFSPDGRYVLSAGYHSDIALWDFAAGIIVRSLKGHIAGVHRAVFAPDGRRVVSGSDDHTVRVWDVQTGRELAMFEGHQDYVLDVDISPDGRFAASVSGGDHEDGKWVAGDDFSVRIWRLPQVNTQPREGLRLANLEGGPGGEYSRLGGIQADVLALDLSEDGRLLATGEKNGTVRIWELEANRTIARLPPHNDMVRAVAFSPDGKRLVTGTHKKLLRLWDVDTQKELLTCPADLVPSQILTADFLADGRRVAFGVHGSVRIWDTDANTVMVLKAPPIHPHMIAVSPDGSMVAAASHDSIVRLWDTKTGELLHELPGHTDEVQGVDFAPDGRRLVSCSRDATVRLWDVESGDALRTFNGYTNWIYSVKFLADGRRVMSGATHQDGSIRTWDTITGEQVWRITNDTKITRHIAATPDARFAVAANSATVSVLRLPELRNMTKLEEYELARRNEGPEIRIAVLEFVDRGPSVELAPLRTALAELLTARLNQYRRVTAVERVQVDQFLKETKLGASGLVDADTAQLAGKVLTADYLLSGSFSGRDGAITIDATLTKVGAEEPLSRWTVSGKASELFEVEQQLATRSLSALGIKAPKLDSNPPAELGVSPTIAVLSFKNLGTVASESGPNEKATPESTLNDLQAGFGEFLQVALSALPDVTLVEREDLDTIVAEQELSLSSLTNAKTAARIGKLAGAQRFIYGSFLESGGKLTVIARLADTETATVLATEIADGTADDIATMLQQLALRLASRLNVRQPKDAGQLVWRAVPVRRLEAAVYGSRARAFVRKGNYIAAFDDFDRALLVEPDNLDLRKHYIRALYMLGRIEKLIQVADDTLAIEMPEYRKNLRSSIYAYYLSALMRANRHEKRVEVARRYAKEFPGGNYQERRARAAEARSLRGSNRREEAVALLEAEVMKAEASGNTATYGDELAQLFRFYDSELMFYSGGSRVPKITEEGARRAVETAERLLELCKGRNGRSAAYWGRVIVPRAVQVAYYKEDKTASQFYLSVDERIDLLDRARGIFSWNAEIMSRASFELGEHAERGEHFQQALEAFREYLANGYYAPAGVVSSYDRSYVQPNGWIDHQLEAQYRIGRILHEELNEPEAAIAAYQEFVRNYGLANFHGPHVTKGLKELGVEPDTPERSVLLWGGASETLHSWQQVLQPLGFTTHMVRQYHLTAPDLAPYDLVVLIRTGDLPFDPLDVFGLRSYVATG
jgi:WD40 repeat protein/TolB-like protein